MQCRRSAMSPCHRDITGCHRLAPVPFVSVWRFETPFSHHQTTQLATSIPSVWRTFRVLSCPAKSLHSDSLPGLSLDQIRPAAHRQRALCVLASKQRGFAIPRLPRNTRPRDEVAPENAVSGAKIVSKSLNRVTGRRSVTREQADSFQALTLTYLLASCPSRHLHATGSQPPSCDVCSAKKRSYDRHMTVTASHLGTAMALLRGVSAGEGVERRGRCHR